MCTPEREMDQKLKVDQPVWEVIATGGQTVYLKFNNNSFRKHFVLPAKHSTTRTTQQKAENKQYKRALMTPMAKKAGLVSESGMKQIRKRYGSPAPLSRVIDLSVIDLRSALLDIANTLLATNIGTGLQEVQFTLSKACVIETTSLFQEGKNPLVVKSKVGLDAINLKVRLEGGQYEFG
jgi:hypothetical protein